MAAQLHGTMIKMENFQKLLELKKDLIGIDNLVIPGRHNALDTACSLSAPDRPITACPLPSLQPAEPTDQTRSSVTAAEVHKAGIVQSDPSQGHNPAGIKIWKWDLFCMQIPLLEAQCSGNSMFSVCA
ncbi:UNVERIFIED_CONTAM: hypothetical protein FKN15_074732 [Acipenser sinensis]